MRSKRRADPVYSTETGKLCPDCGQPEARCLCRSESAASRGDGTGRVRRETKGRKGKCVTVVEGLPLDSGQLQKLGKELKAACGSGGTVKEGRIEIQGEHCSRVIQELGDRGWTVKKAGG